MYNAYPQSYKRLLVYVFSNLLAQLAFLPSVISFFYPKQGKGAPRAPPLDPPLNIHVTSQIDCHCLGNSEAFVWNTSPISVDRRSLGAQP